MAQAKVTDFFAARKGNRAIHPSKRRKLQNVAEEPREVKPILEGKTIILPTVRESTRSRGRVKQEDLKGTLALPTRATRSQTKTKQNNPTVQITSSRSKPAGQPHIKNVLSVKQEPSSAQSNPDADNACQSKPSRSRTPSPGQAAETSTAACDDHTASPPGTPTKQPAKSAQTSQVIQPVGRKRGRLDKSTRKDLLTDVTPETSPEATTGYDFSKFLKVKDTTLTKEGSPSVRKKLVMKRRSGESLAEAAKESTVSTLYYCENNLIIEFKTKLLFFLSFFSLRRTTLEFKFHGFFFLLKMFKYRLKKMRKQRQPLTEQKQQSKLSLQVNKCHNPRLKSPPPHLKIQEPKMAKWK